MGEVVELGPAKLRAMLAEIVDEGSLPEATKKRVVEDLLPLLELADLSQLNQTFPVSLPAGTYDRAEFEETLSRLYSRRWTAWGHGSNIASILSTTGSLAAFGWAARALYVIFRSL